MSLITIKASVLIIMMVAFAPATQAIQRPPCMDEFSEFEEIYEEELMMLKYHLAMVDWIVEDGLFYRETTRTAADAALIKLEQAAADLRAKWTLCGEWKKD